MKKRARHLPARFTSDQSGNALILVLIFLLLGSLMLVPVLDHIGTALKTGVRYEEKANALYAADSGVEDGIWQIKYDGLQTLFDGAESFNYNFTTNASYVLDDPVNGLTTNVTIQNIWIPSNVTLGDLGLSADDAKTIIDSEKLIVSGTSGATPGQPYHIMIQFVPAAGDNLTIKSVGVWLPQGFTYVEDSCTLEDMFEDYSADSVNISSHCGGQAIVWSYNSPYPLYTSFPNLVSENDTLTSTIQFNYTPPSSDPTKMPAAVAWVTTEMADSLGNPKPNPNSPVNVPISWDVDTRIYKISSKAGNTRVEAYSSKRELRDLNDAISGDYVAIGNSLMTDEIGTDHIKDTWKSSSYTTLTSIPSNADVMAAYLYWSGFRNNVTLFTDAASDFNNWTRGSVDQTRVPISDNDTDGTWNFSSYWDDVDETTANDTDYMTGTTDGGGYKLFGFSPFSLPSGLPVTDLAVYIRVRDVSDGGNSIRPYIKVNGTRYNTAPSNDPGTSFTTYSYSYLTNPNTGAAWTVADLNKTGANPLQLIGVDSSDLKPDIDVSMVYARASDSRWTIESNKFRGIGSASANTTARTLTLQNSLNLSSYAPGTVAVIWDQTEGGTLEPTDTLYFSFSGDGGSTWSSDIEAFHDDSPDSPYYYYIPTAYMTSNFKIRFYFNFDSPDEYVYLDNISINYMPPDTSINFSINDLQVYLDGDGNAEAGAQPLTASASSVLVNATWGGYSFACHRDVSRLVKKYPIVPGEQHHTGNAKYTIGDVQADTGQHVSYAGWSLIVIYFSPETAGHYLYLRDVFSFNNQYENLDFDNDGQPGGDITNFIIPEPIRNKDGVITETVAARLTCFVGEGDDWLYGSIPNTDCVKITGQQSGSSTYLSNSSSPDYNVWNSASPGMSYQGVDVDTFEVLWSQNILMPNDTRLHLDFYSGQDAWNLIYIIISVRSKTTVGGTEHYIILDE